jgi:hypothetical protein
MTSTTCIARIITITTIITITLPHIQNNMYLFNLQTVMSVSWRMGVVHIFLNHYKLVVLFADWLEK